ncbi:hypothetical protein Bpfe_000595 [Biomphalaria pfeifferi]|uniref:Uncharacterized protein n=1 Tax=Biomphalaria pfeifferi TaxID=112525 RepID=A0AAD8CB22_BIOPF|nr:hypothetical protein Bpfe_000595 [Biomphalaria pfeifferi]
MNDGEPISAGPGSVLNELSHTEHCKNVSWAFLSDTADNENGYVWVYMSWDVYREGLLNRQAETTTGMATTSIRVRRRASPKAVMRSQRNDHIVSRMN